MRACLLPGNKDEAEGLIERGRQEAPEPLSGMSDESRAAEGSV